MNLTTTLIIKNNGVALKTHQRSQFLHFTHPLKVLKKADNDFINNSL